MNSILKYRRVLVVFLLALFFQIKGQQNRLDSLNTVFQKEKADSVKIDLLISIAREYNKQSKDTAFQLLKKAQAVIEQHVVLKPLKPLTENKNYMYYYLYAKLLHEMADGYDVKNDNFNSALVYEQEISVADFLSKNDPGKSRIYEKQKSIAYNNCGNAYRRKGDYPKALKSFFEGIKTDEKLENEKGLSVKYGNLGIVYAELRNYEQALNYYLKALEIKQKLGNKKSILSTIINVGVAYKNLNRLDLALDYDTKALAICEELKLKPNKSLVLGNIGVIYILRKEYTNARKHIEEALKIDVANNFKSSELIHLGNMGSLNAEQKDYKKAISYFERSYALAMEIGDLENIKVNSQELSDHYKKLAEAGINPAVNFKRALEYQQKFKIASDSLFNEEKAKEQVKVELNYEFGKKEAEAKYEIDKITKEKKISELELQKANEQRKNLIITIVSGVLILLILFVLVFFLFKNIRERKSAYIKLQEKNIEIQRQAELLLSQSKQITRYQTQMNPHFVFNALNSIQGFVVNNEREKTLIQLQSFSRLMRQTLNNSTTDVISLKNEIEYLQLYVAFERERFSNPIEFIMSVESDENEVLIPPMMIQPFIENALKHAGLNDIQYPVIQLSIVEQGDLLKISISDNGKGITRSKEDIIRNSHAISIIRSRLKLLFEKESRLYKEEYFELCSMPESERGTRIEFWIPLVTAF